MNYIIKHIKNSWTIIVLPFLVALLAALLFRSFIFQGFIIPSGSMIPNLLVGDHVFVSKYFYGYSRFSFPYDLIPIPNRFSINNVPKRSDIVVFRGEISNNIDYIKRIIGLPGDRIQMVNGILYINYKPVKIEKIQDFVDSKGNFVPQFLEILPDNKKHTFIKYNLFGSSSYDNVPIIIIPDNYYFMMGDNRDKSSDSRDFKMDLIPFNNLIGRAEIVFLSIRECKFLSFWCWADNVRYLRFIHKIS